MQMFFNICNDIITTFTNKKNKKHKKEQKNSNANTTTNIQDYCDQNLVFLVKQNNYNDMVDSTIVLIQPQNCYLIFKYKKILLCIYKSTTNCNRYLIRNKIGYNFYNTYNSFYEPTISTKPQQIMYFVSTFKYNIQYYR